MELLATLPAIVGLVAKGELKNTKEENSDWIQFLSECLCSAFDISEIHKKSLTDFLRLYTVLNADEDGGIPGVHVTEIIGASQLCINQALAAGALAYTDEPKTGTMSQVNATTFHTSKYTLNNLYDDHKTYIADTYAEFQTKIQRLFGRDSKEEKLRNYIATLIKSDKLIGYKVTEFCDPRYKALENYAKEYLPNDSSVKTNMIFRKLILSQNVSQILTTMMKAAKGKSVYPEQSAIAAPIFQVQQQFVILEFSYLSDMKFNQVLLCMSRALGAIASIIWTRAVNASVEHPTSKCTYTYLNSVQGTRGKRKRGKHAKHTRK
ncbi:citrate synthase, mitochondrial [Xylocopa sonorina]|uniref:citrate synthase, mitochondrial n=1 Tax=Xylocopa sonorina TaxID=1818115 RepID=UPI00403B1785